MSVVNAAEQLIEFVNDSPSPYHAVANAISLLKENGFVELHETERWGNLAPNGKYFVVRNGSSIIAFATGGKWQPGNGFAIVGAHTDSPCLRVKPESNRSTAGYIQVGVETYGGGLWPTWFDRDLSLAGRVLFRNAGSKGYQQKLVNLKKPLLRIPTLAIHLHREQNTKLEFNMEQHLEPVLGLVKESLLSDNVRQHEGVGGAKSATARHHPRLLDVIANAAGCSPDDIEDFELVLFDTQSAALGGLDDEFIFAPRQDNLNSSFCALKGLIEANNLKDVDYVQAIALFDHEEVGSVSTQGAASNFLEAIVSRVSGTTPYETLAKSMLLSADMAHAIHPNYSAKHEAKHAPAINKGPVIKINANQRYATNSPGIVLLQNVAQRAEVPLQLFVVRNDSPCGSTIGPIMASRLGVRTLDLGNPQLSMHSIRETAGTADVSYSIALFKSFFENFGQVESSIQWLPGA